MQELSKDVALRLALAARSLPGADVRCLLDVLLARHGAPLTQAHLGKVTVADLKTDLYGEDGEDDGQEIDVDTAPIKRAVQALWGLEPDDGQVQIEPPLEGERVVRVAFSSNSGELLNGHFGSCLQFLVYDLSATETRLVAVRPTAEADEQEDRNAARVAAIGDCHVVFVQSVGGPAAAKITRKGLTPIKRPEGGAARDYLAELQSRLNSSPPPWLAKVLGTEPNRQWSEPTAP